MEHLTAACVTLLLLVGLVAQEAATKDPCSKDWLRFMVVNACGMDKRHLERRKPSVAPSLKEILKEVDQEFDNYVYGQSPFEDNYEENYEYEPAASESTPERVDARDKGVVAKPSSASSEGNFFMRLFQHPDQVLAEAWMGLVASEPKKMPRRRAIQNAISRCCSEDCDEGDFDGVCD
ncbi:uncharacterized protein LOC117641040 [Thrips palmi]|uniref:Uncharacterized protein LOC117641040 n=1 Tax=Thrips palmi TaxID=161013 RepID=A0A6P8YJA3_THRPL|nr:uncharacterized protein LOC117641040 [Thrips palmi]